MGVAMVALFAFGAILAASAFAVTFLLAEWLVGGAAVTSELLAEVAAEPGEVLLEDTALKATVLCSGVGDGWIGPNSLYWGSEVLSLEGGVVNTTALSAPGLACTAQSGCEASHPVTAWIVNLPYEGEVVLMEDGGTTYFAGLLSAHPGGGTPGWEIECSILFVKSSDECSASTSVVELTLEGTSLLAKTSEEFTLLAELKLGLCTFAGGETGILEGGGVIALVGGGELAASSEGVVS
jgi:hypothetical protein